MQTKMNKKIFLGSLAVFVLGGIGFCQAEGFSDVDESHPNYSAISSLAQKNIVEGYADGTFKPEQKINRAEFLKIITESIFAEDEIKNCTKNNLLSGWEYAFFSDVDRDIWYANYVCQGKMKRVVNGYGDGTFRPADEINYVEALKIIFEANSDRGMQNPVGKEWYSPYLESVNAYYIGLDIEPDKKLTRGEMAELIDGYMSKRQIGKYAQKDHSYNIIKNGFVFLNNDQDISSGNLQKAIDSSYLYKNEEKGFSVFLPNSWKDYEFKVYEWQDDMCNNANVEIYYFAPKNSGDFDFGESNENKLPLNIIRYKKEDYCTESYNWQQEIASLYHKNDLTVDKGLIYLGAVYSKMRTLQNDEYLYQIYPWQISEVADNFVYSADPLAINIAVSSFSIEQ